MIDTVDLRRMRYLINRIPRARHRLERAATKAAAMVREGNGDEGELLLRQAEVSMAAIVGELDGMTRELQPMIALLEDADERTAMQLRYIDRYRPEDVADGMGYCERHAFRILKRAEKRIEEQMDLGSS